MSKFRIVRGKAGPDGKKWGFGTTVEADTVKEAIKKEHAEAHKSDPMMDRLIGRIQPSPVFAVYELVPVPESDWK